ncbi:MAG: hypothetical protein HY673_01555 [Chloroflexi bacterium]|nr:hypothetical protein [Chloroflexota bacterium]
MPVEAGGGSTRTSTRTSSLKAPAGRRRLVLPSREVRTASWSGVTVAAIVSTAKAEGVGGGVEAGVGDAAAVEVGVAEALAVGVGEGEGPGVAVGAAAGDGEGVANGGGEAVGDGGSGVGPGLGVSDGTAEGEAVGGGVRVGEGVGEGGGIIWAKTSRGKTAADSGLAGGRLGPAAATSLAGPGLARTVDPYCPASAIDAPTTGGGGHNQNHNQ